MGLINRSELRAATKKARSLDTQINKILEECLNSANNGHGSILYYHSNSDLRSYTKEDVIRRLTGMQLIVTCGIYNELLIVWDETTVVHRLSTNATGVVVLNGIPDER